MTKNFPTKEDTIQELTKFKERVANIHNDRKEIRDLSKEIMDVLIQYWYSFKFGNLTHNAGLDDAVLYKDYSDGSVDGLYFRWMDQIEELLEHISKLENKSNFVYQKAWEGLCDLFLKSKTISGCYCCGKEYSLIANPETQTIEMLDKSICPFPNGIEDAKSDIPIKSGKLVFANIFGDIIPNKSQLVFEFAKKRYGYYQNINSLIGSVMNFEFEASRGIAYIFTGNTCPSVFKNKENGLISIKNSYEKKDYEQEVGSICTDLWAVQAIDYELLKNYYKEAGDKENEINIDTDFEEYLRNINAFIVDVKPGIYTVTFSCKFPNNYNDDNEQTYFGDIVFKE